MRRHVLPVSVRTWVYINIFLCKVLCLLYFFTWFPIFLQLCSVQYALFRLSIVSWSFHLVFCIRLFPGAGAIAVFASLPMDSYLTASAWISLSRLWWGAASQMRVVDYPKFGWQQVHHLFCFCPLLHPSMCEAYCRWWGGGVDWAESTTGYTFTPCVGSFYFPWHRHQIEGTNGFYCLIRKTESFTISNVESQVFTPRIILARPGRWTRAAGVQSVRPTTRLCLPLCTGSDKDYVTHEW